MKTIRYSRVAILIIFFLIDMFIISFVSYSQKQTTYDILSNQLYYEKAFIISDAEQADWSQMQFDHKNYGIFLEIDQQFRIVITDSSDRNPPMIWGEYPRNSTNRPKAVVGKRIDSNLVKIENNKKWIYFLDQKFEVVGVFGTDYASSCDELVILFDPEFDKYVKDKQIVIDSNDNKDLSAIAGIIMSRHPDIELLEREIAGTARITKNSYYFNLLNIEAILLISMSIILISKLQWEKYRNRRKVYFILGIPEKRTIIFQTIEMFFINMVSFIISIVFANLLHLLNSSMFKSVLQINVIILIISVISTQMFLYLDKMISMKAQIKMNQYFNKKGKHKCS